MMNEWEMTGESLPVQIQRKLDLFLATGSYPVVASRSHSEMHSDFRNTTYLKETWNEIVLLLQVADAEPAVENGAIADGCWNLPGEKGNCDVAVVAGRYSVCQFVGADLTVVEDDCAVAAAVAVSFCAAAAPAADDDQHGVEDVA